ncbi:hypothetical protein GCM10009836_55490 [Pseudonocardia ailaonensis]|uniref:Uncharacterized protein n=1 Tax=Pseudonocardia ailaonensis TaxID=367279 RepID=A0ABN2NG54_9PSEU
MKKRFLVSAALLGAVLPTGTALASPTSDAAQAVSAVGATGANAADSFLDAANGPGPTGADGVETEFPTFDPRFVEGPAGGLLNGPFD